MSRALAMARQGLPYVGSRREAIDLVSNLWDIECRHQLGKLSRAEYRQAVAALRGDSGRRCPTLTTRKNNDE